MSNVATATVNITSVNDAPTANSATVNTNEDTPVGITLTGSDVEPGPLTFGIVNQPVHGTLSGSLPNLTYTPAANYNGPDAFVFKVTDSNGASDPAIIHIEVAAVNDAPTASNVSVGTNQDTPVTVSIAAGDADGDSLTFTPTTPTAAADRRAAPAMTAPTRRPAVSPAPTASTCSSTTETVAPRP